MDSAREPDGARFTVLGPLEVWRDGVDLAPTTPKVRHLLAMLVMHPGRMVHSDAIVEELWSDNPPKSVRTTLHTYVHHLRRNLDMACGRGGTILETKPPGYVFRIDPAQVDVYDFQQLVRDGRAMQRAGQHADAAEAYRRALDLWSGQPLANVASGPRLSAYITDLLEQRRTTLHLRIEAEIDSGMHRELIGELRSLTSGNPLDEVLHGQLMRALGRSGRRSDAMDVYRHLRTRLTEELGVEPYDELRTLYQELLSQGEL